MLPKAAIITITTITPPPALPLISAKSTYSFIHAVIPLSPTVDFDVLNIVVVMVVMVKLKKIHTAEDQIKSH